jgi:hepatocyte growth factor-regulated tyrosine kinase substrate
MTLVAKKVRLPFAFRHCVPDLSTVSSELLTEMNDKLAQAVKLYDQILTQQVSRPTWRHQTASPPVQPYGQRNYVQSPSSVQLANAPASQAWHQPSSIYTSSQAYPSSVDTSSLSQSPQQTWSQPSYVPSAASPPPTTASQMSPQPHTVPTSQSPTSYQYQYAHPIKPVSIQQLAPPAPPPGHAITPSQHPVASVSTQSTPVHQQLSPPPPVPHHQRPQPQQPPSRHNTIAQGVHVSPPHLQQQFAPPPAPAPALPNFPSVPTAPPSIPYSSHDTAPSAVEPAQKEALLIEL